MLLATYQSESYSKKIDERNDNKQQGDGLGYFIEIDEFVIEEDVKHAFRMISRAQETRPKTGRQPRDRLECVEASVLHDRDGWTYEELAERYKWNDPTLASKYVKDGRATLKSRRNPAGF